MKLYLIQVQEYNTYMVEAKNKREARKKFNAGNYDTCPQDDDGNQEIIKITEDKED